MLVSLDEKDIDKKYKSSYYCAFYIVFNVCDKDFC